MPSAAARVSPEEYLERERAAETKSEYRNGEIVAMAGASVRHAVIISNLVIELGSRLRKRPCNVFSTDLRSAARAANLFAYPDVMVVCGPPELADERQDILLNPVIIVEVLSKSTANYDRSEKFASYRTIPSLKEYLTVAQDGIHIEQHVRQPDERWVLAEFTDPAATLRLESIGVELRVGDVYENIDFMAS